MNDNEALKSGERTYKESEVAVILEDIKGKFDLLAEGQEGIRREIKEFRREVDSRFNQVLEYLSRVEDELMEVKNDLKALKEKPDKEEFIKLEKRVATLEKKLEMYKLKAA